jgi:transcriptional regulator with XRE-family HTH domain
MLHQTYELSAARNIDPGVMQSWLKRRLKEIGRNQGELAAHLGRDPSIVSRIATGEQNVNLRQIEAIAEFLDMDPRQVVSLLSTRGRPMMPVSGFIVGDAEIVDEVDATPENQLLAKVASVPRPADLAMNSRAFVTIDSRDRRYRKGDVIYCEPVRIDASLGDATECYVELAGGRRLIRWVNAGSAKGLYTLVSGSGEATIDTALVAAYRVRQLRTIDIATLHNNPGA